MIILVECFYLVIECFYVDGYGMQICLFYEVFGGVWDVLVIGWVDLVIGVFGDMLVCSGISSCLFGYI